MGTDIHAALEIRKNGKWETQLSPNKWFGKYDDEPKLYEMPWSRHRILRLTQQRFGWTVVTISIER